MKEFWSSRIRNIVPYTPGEQPKEQKFIKLNTNENPYPPSPKVMEAIRQESGEKLRLYPDPEASSLRRAAAELYGLSPEEVFVGNGSDEVLAFSFEAFFEAGKTIAFPDITYSFYPVFAELFDIPYEQIPLNEDFTLPVDSYCRGNYAGIVVCNPNAPTGIQLPLSEIEKIIRANPDVVVLVDEAYIDFGGNSAIKLIHQYPNLLITQTMSKSRSLAGMRIGLAFGSQNLIMGLNAVKNSFNSYTLDRLAIAAGTAALEDKAYFETTRDRVIETRESSAAQLRELGFIVLPSCTNFLFIRHPDVSAVWLYRKLRENGILVRHFNQARINDYLRVTIGTQDEMKIFCAVMARLLQESEE